jgi:AcrR family transcriptional regulator
MAGVHVTARRGKQTRARSAEARGLRREAILDAAEQLFSEQRFVELHMSRIAKELGLAKGTLYLYFPSKEGLFLAVVERGSLHVPRT